MERMERMATFYCCSPHKSIYLPFISKTAITGTGFGKTF